MSKHTKALKHRLADIDAELDQDPKPKKALRLRMERDEIGEELKKSKLVVEVKPIPEHVAENVGEALDRKIYGDEAVEAGKRHLAHLELVGELEAERKALTPKIDAAGPKKAKKLIDRVVEINDALTILRDATRERTLAAAHETTGRNLKSISERTDTEIKAAVLAKRAARASQEEPGSIAPERATVDFMGQPALNANFHPERCGGQTEQEAGAIHIEDEPLKKPTANSENATIPDRGKPIKVTFADGVKESVEDPIGELTDDQLEEAEREVGRRALVAVGEAIAEKRANRLIDLEEVQPRDRWGRPEIVRPDGTVKGYRRMTTFIDVIDDKDNLVKWKGRVILAGVAATEQKIAGDSNLLTIDEVGTESIIERVEAANQALEKLVKAAKKHHKKGTIDDATLQEDLDRAEKTHRSALSDLAEEAFQAGDGYLKAETGTRIHKLSEFVDRGEDLPEDTTDVERRDIAAYVAARDALGVEVKLIEQFVVLDDLEVGGTLDRLIRIDSPKLGRRVTAIGDVKTGRMDFGAGKMARQLAGYARGKKYDWRDPEHTRTAMRANQEVGYIFNVPAGQGVCFVYELDLKLGAKGLKLCKDIFDYRAETSTLKKVGALIYPSKE